MKFKILLGFFFSVILGCSNNTVEDQLSVYHNKISPTPDQRNEVNLILKREINKGLFGILYKMNNTDNLYYGFVKQNNDIVKVFRVNNNKESRSDFNKRICLVKKENGFNVNLDDGLACYSIFVGEVPFEEFSEIKLEWNCSEKNIDSQDLVHGKYYYFIKEGKDNNICNISLYDTKGTKTKISYNSENGQWKF